MYTARLEGSAHKRSKTSGHAHEEGEAGEEEEEEDDDDVKDKEEVPGRTKV